MQAKKPKVKHKASTEEAEAMRRVVRFLLDYYRLQHTRKVSASGQQTPKALESNT